MHITRLGVVAAALLLLSVAPARAQGFVTPHIGFNYGGDSANCASLTNCEDRQVNWGLTVGKTAGLFGFQSDFGYAPNFFGESPDGGGSAVLHFMSDFMLVIPAGPVQPYGFIGIGLIRSHAKLVDAASLKISQNALGHNLGAGLNIFIGRVGVHGELRHVRTFKDFTLGVFSNDKLDFWRANTGLTFRF